MKIQSSAALLKFYKEWLEWQEQGGNGAHRTFMTWAGLCPQLRDWVVYDAKMGVLASRELRYELKSQFITAGLDRSYPFTTERGYEQEAEKNTAHLNPVRVAWVKARIADGEA